jgi:hypothetical protein
MKRRLMRNGRRPASHTGASGPLAHGTSVTTVADTTVLKPPGETTVTWPPDAGCREIVDESEGPHASSDALSRQRGSAEGGGTRTCGADKAAEPSGGETVATDHLSMAYSSLAHLDHPYPSGGGRRPSVDWIPRRSSVSAIGRAWFMWVCRSPLSCRKIDSRVAFSGL